MGGAPPERAFRFVQFEFPWALGPPDGRYVLRDEADGPPTHVLVIATLGAPERRRLRARRGGRAAAPEPAPAPVTTGRATIVDAQPVARADAERWLGQATEEAVEAALASLARAVRAHRIATADPGTHEPRLAQALVVRAGYGEGEQVAQGRWSAARELPRVHAARQRRRAVLRPQERLAALLSGRSHALACEELALRARHDLDHGHPREAALQLRAALAAALSELAREPDTPTMAERLRGLEERRVAVDALADAALGGVVPPDADATLAEVLGRLEAALRARSAGQA
jgi:hypothetical protein